MRVAGRAKGAVAGLFVALTLGACTVVTDPGAERDSAEIATDDSGVRDGFEQGGEDEPADSPVVENGTTQSPEGAGTGMILTAGLVGLLIGVVVGWADASRRGRRRRATVKLPSPPSVPTNGPSDPELMRESESVDVGQAIAAAVAAHDQVDNEAQRMLVADVLEHLGVRVLEPSGEQFDPSRHLALGSETIDHSDLDRVVARTIRPGWVTANGTVVRPAEVIVWRGGGCG